MTDSEIKNMINAAFNINDEDYYPPYQKVTLELARKYERQGLQMDQYNDVNRLHSQGFDPFEVHCIINDAKTLYKQRKESKKPDHPKKLLRTWSDSELHILKK